MNGVVFEFDGVAYEVDPEVYEAGKIVLPDGRLFEVESWTRSYPKVPLKLIEMKPGFMGDPEEIANRYDAVLAILADQ